MADPYNRAAVRRHALRISQLTRAGKFTRVSEKFIDDVLADVDNEVRKLRAPTVSTTYQHVDSEENFLTGAGNEQLVAAFNLFVGKIIQRRVHLTRCGKTL